MQVLLVEDSDPKAKDVESLLRSTVAEITIHRASSYRSCVKKLESQVYDLLILDLVLPVRDGESPDEQGGKRVLAEIQDGSDIRHPSHIICLTAFSEIVDGFRDEAKRRLIHVVLYNDLASAWRESLKEKTTQIQKRIQEADLFPQSYGSDIAILTSSPIIELQEILKIPGFTGEFHQSDSLYYYSNTWRNVEGKQISVVACAAPAMGMTAASITACKLVARWRPKFLVMSGIAAATKSDLNFGDILVAESAYDYGSGKITDTEENRRLFTPSYSQLKVDATLGALLQRWEREQFRADSIRTAWHAQLRTNPRIVLGLLASGAAVVQSSELVTEILERSRKVVGLDMEAYGVFHAAHLASAPRPKVLVAKSVSDFADHRKSDEWQQFAAFTSARFIYEFFTNETELEIGS